MRAAFCKSFSFAAFSLLSASSLPPLGAPAAFWVIDLMYFCTCLLLFLFFMPKVLSTATFSRSFCLALSTAFGGIASTRRLGGGKRRPPPPEWLRGPHERPRPHACSRTRAVGRQARSSARPLL